jgi:hypothetical protein
VATRGAPTGRGDVLAELHRVIDAAAAGRGELLMLAGEAGIGKTTMLAEAARYAESRGVRVAWGWGWPGEGAPGYWPWVQAMRALGLDSPLATADGRPAADDAPASARFQLFDEVTSLLLAESRIQPLLVLLDDLQWADRPSQLLLDFLARRLPAGAAAVVGAYRDVAPAPGPALTALAARTTVLPLAGLPAAAIAELIAGIVGAERAAEVAADVHRRTGGNPFFAQQVSWLLAGGGDGVPPGVREALAQRFAGLPAGCAAALGAAAVLGPRFPADLVARLTGSAPAQAAQALAEAIRARVLAADGGDGTDGYRFAHDLFREYAYDQLTAAQRARLHQRAGTELEAERARGGDVSLAELAWHFVQADPGSGVARRYCVAAALAATNALAYEEAAAHWVAALAASHDAAARTEALIELGEARRRAGDGQAAGEAYLRAADLAGRESDGAGLARAALGLHALGSRMWWPPGQIVSLAAEALDALSPTDDEQKLDNLSLAAVTDSAARSAGLLRLRVMASLARVLSWHRIDVPRGRELAAQAVAAARESGDQPTLAACLLAQHNALFAPGTADQRHALAAELAELARAADDPETHLEARLLAATDLLEQADPAFRGELDEFFRLADASGQPRFRYAALVRRTMLALLDGRLAEAGRLLEQAAMLGAECGEPGVQDVRWDQGWDLLAAQGRLGELAGSLPQMFPDPESVQARGSRALVLLAAGATDEAAEVIAPVLARGGPDDSAQDNQSLLGAAFGTQLAEAFDAAPAAAALYAVLLPFAGQAVVSGVAVTFQGAVCHHLGVLAAVRGETGAAARHLADAIAVHDRLGAVTWTLRSRYELARVWLTDPARSEAAVAELAAVAGAAHRLGMTRLAADAERAGFAAGRGTVSSGVFARSGAVWTLGYGGVTVRMRDAKGLADLAALLAAPEREIAAADLIAAGGAGRTAKADLGLGADEVLDPTARRQIRGRLADLADEIAEAESWNDPEREARARTERDVLLHELASATGPGGRARLLGDQSERARKAVTARIRDSIGRIDAVHPALGAHLRASVTTGTRCAYSPPAPVHWQL